MTALFGGRQRRRDHEPALAELPAWGLEIMMALYGPETIQRECAREEVSHERVRPQRARRDQSRVSMPERREPAIDGQCVDDAARCDTARSDSARRDDALPPPSPLIVELEAMNELVKYLERKLKRH
ncbi:hypothetical protein ACIGKQ_20290 [Gordonia sp. NPDC062954]|uniref:hypothetical protein n=1 Tax=Gordonia sp. NPDC062954 TaxID=3364003 RepID=UPI0037CC9BAB